jgi:hypothetical protein
MNANSKGQVAIPLNKDSENFGKVCAFIESIVASMDSSSLYPEDIMEILTGIVCYTVAKINSCGCGKDHPEDADVSRADFVEILLKRVTAIDETFATPEFKEEILARIKIKEEKERPIDMPFYAWGPEITVEI